jgi:hypothetical protein
MKKQNESQRVYLYIESRGVCVITHLKALVLVLPPGCNERLKSKSEGSIRLIYTGLCGGMEHLKIESRLRGGRLRV